MLLLDVKYFHVILFQLLENTQKKTFKNLLTAFDNLFTHCFQIKHIIGIHFSKKKIKLFYGK